MVVLTGKVVLQRCGDAFVTPVDHGRVTAGAGLAHDFGLLVGSVTPALPWPAEVFSPRVVARIGLQRVLTVC